MVSLVCVRRTYVTRPRWRGRLNPAWQHPAGGCLCPGPHGPGNASAAGAGGARGCSRTAEPGPAEGRSRRDRDHSADTSYIPWRKSSHRDLRPAGRATRIHASDSLYAWAWYQRSGGGAAALAEDQGPAELQATHGGGTGGGPGTTRRQHRWRTGRCAAAPVEDRGRRTSREPAAGVMDRRRSGQSSDSESRSLRTAGLAQPAGPRHSPAPTGVGRGRSRLGRVEGSGGYGEPGRTGRRPRCTVAGVFTYVPLRCWV